MSMGRQLAGGEAREAYEVLAPFYDDFIDAAGHDYDAWAAMILDLGGRHGLGGQRMLDVGCGTGRSFMPFVAAGWRVTACDVSPRMLAIASAKAPRGVELHEADVRALPALGRFDLVLLLDDVINYLAEPGELEDAFAGVAANLAEDGTVVFDANTLRGYREGFSGSHAVEAPSGMLVWRGALPADATAGAVAEATLDAFAPDGADRWTRHGSVHRQRHHDETAIRSALGSAGLACAAVYGHGRDGVAHPGVREERDTKALYIARHGAPGGERR